MRSIAVTIAAGIFVVALPLTAHAEAPSRQPVYTFAGTPVEGGWSQLTRGGSGVRFALSTRSLAAGHAVTIWWVVFNAPENCVHPTPFSACGAGDLPPFGGDDSAETSVLYAAGHVTGDSGRASFAGRLAPRDTDGAVFGSGLTDPYGAEIHLVVRDHGNVPPQDRADAIHQFGVCEPECVDIQFSVQQ